MAFSIPPGTLEEIKARTDLADLVSSYGIQVRRAGASQKACCPFHHEKTPSFNIQNEKGFYHCFGCHESGDCFTFVMKMEGLTFVEAARKLAAAAGVTIEEKEDPHAKARGRLLALHAELTEFFRRCLKQTKAAAAARAYLASRDLGEETCAAFGIGYVPAGADAILTWAGKHGFTPEELELGGVLRPPRSPGDHWYNAFGGRVAFAIRDRSGRTVGFSCRTLETDKAKMRGGKYVNTPATPIFDKSSILYALDHAAGPIARAPRREAIVCEGQIDVVRCHAAGFDTAVASQGTAFTEKHVALLKKCADSVVLVFDADGAGQKAAVRTGGLFLAADMPVRVATLPEGEDPDSLIRARGPSAFQTCLDAAESITAFQVRTLTAQETRPLQIDAVRRVSRAVLETIAKCTSAVLRAALLAEAAKLLELPVAALEEDFAKVKDAAAHGVHAPPPPAPDEEEEPFAAPRAPDVSCVDFTPRDAGDPRVNPPPKRELAFCEFLFAHEREAELAALVAAGVPEGLFAHAFTARFTAAWLAEANGGGDEIAALRAALAPEECRWLDAILLAAEKSAVSELEPAAILRDYLRQFWIAAVRRRQGALAAASNPENDRRRLEYSRLARDFQRGKWETIAPRMTAATLA